MPDLVRRLKRAAVAVLATLLLDYEDCRIVARSIAPLDGRPRKGGE